MENSCHQICLWALWSQLVIIMTFDGIIILIPTPNLELSVSYLGASSITF